MSTSTVNTSDQPSLSSSTTTNLFSNGLYNSLIPSINILDKTINSLYNEQYNTAQKIDNLANLINLFKSIQEQHNKQPLDFIKYADKLSSARKRVKRINYIVNNINTRLNECKNTIKKKEGIIKQSNINAVDTQNNNNTNKTALTHVIEEKWQ